MTMKEESHHVDMGYIFVTREVWKECLMINDEAHHVVMGYIFVTRVFASLCVVCSALTWVTFL